MVKLNHRVESKAYRSGEYGGTSCSLLHKEWLHEDVLEYDSHKVLTPELKLNESLALTFLDSRTVTAKTYMLKP